VPVLGSPLPRASALVPLPRLDVVHFLTQQGFTTRVPSLYTPHDLLHLHHPEFFTPADLNRRERVYRGLCAQAWLVTVMTPWGRNDLIEQYGLEPERVRVVPWGAPLPATDDAPTKDIRERYGLPTRFALYPAHTWPHKNHERLLEALAILRDRHGLRVPLVCTGHQDVHAERIHDRVTRLGLGGQVQTLGRVSSADLLALYRLARCLVFPSLFEGWGMPVFEAFASSLPVVCSTATSLPDQTRGAAVLFDPLDVEEMALAVASVWEDDRLRARLVASGQDRVRTLTWRRTAVAYRALYRELGGSTMDTLDRAMVEASRNGVVESVDLPAL
jgi:glycosyltransferase involved in cell wall biosynthesis